MDRVRFWSKPPTSLLCQEHTVRARLQEPASAGACLRQWKGRVSRGEAFPFQILADRGFPGSCLLNSLGTCPGPGTSLPVPLNQRLAPCWPACSYTILEAKRIYSLKYKLFCPSGSQCPDNVTGHIFSIVVEVVMIFKRLWWTFLYGVTEQFSSIYKQIEVVT